MSADPLKYLPTDTADAFHKDKSLIRALLGPVGCGKSVACCMEIFRIMMNQEPGRDGFRRTKAVCIRNTYPELVTTTIKTWKMLFPTPETAATNPLSPYGLQKYIGEQYCTLYSQLYGLDTVSLRYFNVYGEGMPLEGAYRTVISIFGEQYRKGEPLTYTNDGEQRRDFTYVGDVVAANILAGDCIDKLNGEVFNVGNGSNFSVNEVIAMFGTESKFFESRIEPACTLADNSKLRTRFGWQPTGHLPSFIERYKKFLLSL